MAQGSVSYDRSLGYLLYKIEVLSGRFRLEYGQLALWPGCKSVKNPCSTLNNLPSTRLELLPPPKERAKPRRRLLGRRHGVLELADELQEADDAEHQRQ